MTIYMPGTSAPTSGIYAIVDSRGTATGEELPIEKGQLLPPTRNQGNGYVLKQKIEPVYTSVASAHIIQGTATEYAYVIKELAKK